MTNKLPIEFNINKFQPAVIEFNEKEVLDRVNQYLEKYQNHVVTLATLAEDKKLAAAINKEKTSLNKARIDAEKMHMESFEPVSSTVKKAIAGYDEVISAIRNQVKTFEEKTLAKIKAALLALLASEYEKQQVEDKFKTSCIDSLVKLSSFTDKENLTAKAKQEVEALVAADKQQQATVELRLAQLEATCYKLGLAAPLTASHISHFVQAEEAEYQAQLETLIAAEIEREKQAEERRRAQLEAEAKARAEAEMQAKLEAERQARAEQEAKERAEFEAKARAEAEEAAKQQAEAQPQAADTSEPVQQAAQPVESPASGKIAVIGALFELETTENITAGKILGALEAKLGEYLQEQAPNSYKGFKLIEIKGKQ